MGVVLVFAMPLTARRISPMKCRLFSLLSAWKSSRKSQYPYRLQEDSMVTLFIGWSGIFWKSSQNSPPFPGRVLIKTRYFCIGFSN